MIIEAIGVFCDTAEGIRKEHEREQARATAEQALQKCKIFLANISHYIRTSLNAMLSFGELLVQNKSASDDRTYLDVIQLPVNNFMSYWVVRNRIGPVDTGEPAQTAVAQILEVIATTIVP